MSALKQVPKVTTEPRGFTSIRRFAAPPEMVFASWTQPFLLDWFFNPEQPRPEDPVVDLRVGGQWRQKMVESPTKSYFTGGLYREIEPPRRLVFNWGAVGGWPELDLADPDAAPLVTLTFTPEDKGTLMHSRLDLPVRFSDAEVERWFAMGIREGWTMTVDRLVGKLGSL